MLRFHLLVSCLVLAAPVSGLAAREDAVPTNGLHQNTPRIHALVNATAIPAPGKRIENATIILRDGLVEAIGSGLPVPPDARVWDLSGKVVYPGLIDAFSFYGVPDGLKPAKRKDNGAAPKPAPTPDAAGPGHWNPMITPERDIADFLKHDKKQAKALTDLGFTAVASFPGRGIIRGQGALVQLSDEALNRSAVALKVAQHFALDTASGQSSPGQVLYPTSMMGSIALIRQTLLDAQWQTATRADYQRDPSQREVPVANLALDALQPLLAGQQIAIAQAWDELDYQRVARIADEFSLRYAFLGNGYEYRRAAILKDLGATVILPLAFPSAPRVERAEAALDVSLEELQHWELAPSNAAFLEKEGVPFCLTARFCDDPAKEFWNAVRLVVKRGASKDAALASLTTRPAALYGLSNRLGEIAPGKIANLTIATGDLFDDEKAKISHLWIDGAPIEKKPARESDLNGTWNFAWDGIAGGFATGQIKQTKDKTSLKVGDAELPIKLDESEALLFAKHSLFGGEPGDQVVRLQAYVEADTLVGSGETPDGKRFRWTAQKSASAEPAAEEKKPEDKKPEDAPPALVFDRYPAGAYGVTKTERPSDILVRNATVWTSADDGVLEQTDLLVKNGKVAKIGKALKAPKGALVIDAAGKHVTPGLIDCHSHTAVSRGINEVGNAITVEVAIGDSLNPADINLYRQLGGGLTTANVLHGSANPMGGQNQVIKLRWGEDAESLKFAGAKPGVKFALGENVKQSNWGPEFTTRYPQTRMGVEQFMLSQFRAAEDYEREWQAYEKNKSLPLPRKDLRLEAARQILRRERVIHIHSYRQDEILVFARLAKQLNLEVATFQHILEGYKVADILAEIDAGGSSFSDWWAYKFEVYDAIPHNGALMRDAGVVVSFNSDDNELATRLNTEAAKAVKYGNLPEAEALKFVTLNPAIQLRIDDRVGSLEPGKDADFVIWNAHPLSTYARAEQTWIDGVKRFDLGDDQALQTRDQSDRDRLIAKALDTRLKELKANPVTKKPTGGDSPTTESAPEPPRHDQQWIYHDGTHHYSCSGLEEEGH